jgi:hypothetical protein
VEALLQRQGFARLPKGFKDFGELAHRIDLMVDLARRVCQSQGFDSRGVRGLEITGAEQDVAQGIEVVDAEAGAGIAREFGGPPKITERGGKAAFERQHFGTIAEADALRPGVVAALGQLDGVFGEADGRLALGGGGFRVVQGCSALCQLGVAEAAIDEVIGGSGIIALGVGEVGGAFEQAGAKLDFAADGEHYALGIQCEGQDGGVFERFGDHQRFGGKIVGLVAENRGRERRWLRRPWHEIAQPDRPGGATAIWRPWRIRAPARSRRACSCSRPFRRVPPPCWQDRRRLRPRRRRHGTPSVPHRTGRSAAGSFPSQNHRR